MRQLHRQFALPLALLIIPILLPACAINPVTGAREITLISESQEIAMGVQSDGAIVGQYGLYDDSQLAAYVERIGEGMVPVSHRPDLDFHFRLLDDPVVNAFALPGGFVYITRGILAYLNSEAALAGVVGHEIGHVTAKHGVQRMSQQTLLGLGIGVGSMLSEGFASVAGMAGSAGQLLLLKYGRDQERQSDELGVEYGSKIGYDTTDMGEFFRTLDRLSGGGGGLPSWASTHPDPGERHLAVRKLSAEWQGRLSGPFTENRESFLRRLDGLPFGPDPRNGYEKDGEYLHPNLRFRFPIPRGWQLQDSGSQVAVVSPSGDSGSMMSIAEGSSPQASAEAFAQGEGIRILDSSRGTVSGKEAVFVQSAVKAQGGELRLSSQFIAHQGMVFVFHGIAPASGFAAIRSQIEMPGRGFRTLDDARLLGVSPVRVSIVSAPRSGTFREIASAWAIPTEAGLDLAGLAILNGMSLGDPVASGQLLKVLR